MPQRDGQTEGQTVRGIPITALSKADSHAMMPFATIDVYFIECCRWKIATKVTFESDGNC